MNRFVSILTILILLTPTLQAMAHSINYHVEQKGVAVRAYYSKNSVAANSQYELFGPGDKIPHQTGRTDRNGYTAFVPDRAGVWKLQVWGDSADGFHGVTTQISIDKALNLEGFDKPLLATWTKYVTGISLIIGIFGIYSFWLSRRVRSTTAPEGE